MREFADRATERGWGVGRLEATGDIELRGEIADMAAAALRQISAKARTREALLRAARFVKAFTVKAAVDGGTEFSVDLEAALSEHAGADIERDTVKLFAEIGAAAAANGTGIVFLIDQAYGLQAWNAAPEGETIRARDVDNAMSPARDELDRDFFETRFARATKAGRRYLAAMGELGDGPHRSPDVALRGQWNSVTSAGPVRQTLIEKGLIYSPEHGQVDFTVPHFGDFMRRKHPLASLVT